MKKLMSFIAILLLLLIIPVSCRAESVVSINEFGFSISLPDEMYCITPETDNSSPAWKALYLEPDTFREYMKSNNLLLDACSLDFTYEIMILGRDTDNYKAIHNLNQYNDDEIKRLFSMVSKENEKLGIITEGEAIYNSGELKYYTFSGTQTSNNQTFYSHNFVTIVNGHYIRLNFRSYAEPFSDEMETQNKAIVDSIKFNEILKKPATESLSSRSNSSLLSRVIEKAIIALIFVIPATLIARARSKKTSNQVKTQYPNTAEEIKRFTVEPEEAEPEEAEPEEAEPEETEPEEAVISSAVISNADEIRKYKALLDDEIITQEEFDAKKKQLLGL